MFNFLKIRYAYRSPNWRSVRKEHLSNDPICNACGKDNDLEVHHIVPVHVNSELELEVDNLITLCSRCHLVFGHLSHYKSWNENVVDDCKNYNSQVSQRPYLTD